MDMSRNVQYAKMLGANVQLEGSILGPFDLSPETVPERIKEFYQLLGQLGYKRGGRIVEYSPQVLEQISQSPIYIVTDEPVGVYLRPRLGAEKWETHEAWRLTGWPEVDAHEDVQPHDLITVNVGGIDGIEKIITSGVKGKRLKITEAIIRRVFDRN